ncbi:hypothetical protein A1O7_01481 [Cladophialophora yegresii CBS 114405]|uniref:Uncharacterized protein n=1 Tax=Cladophialophora yegresii CBS 114405 TaxID=1182544 RepID=W9WKJ3_9EURO|nr:uncharacterized protein A1O7_01481 [Cladophialophora yegresii CBS 114405]EXJ65141.1 hypothetical protein A1O7_01481 [Cladophialophora yegresii CBS 114405]
MGFWNQGVRSSRSRSRSRSPSRRSYVSRPSYNRSASSIFSGWGGRASSSRGYGYGHGHSSRARPRSGFINRIRRFLHQIYEKFKRHPFRMFMLVIMPLLTSGVLVKLFSSIGIRLPTGMQRMMGGQQQTRQTTERFYSRGGARDVGAGTSLPGMAGPSWGDSLGTVMGIAKTFM